MWSVQERAVMMSSTLSHQPFEVTEKVMLLYRQHCKCCEQKKKKKRSLGIKVLFFFAYSNHLIDTVFEVAFSLVSY